MLLKSIYLAPRGTVSTCSFYFIFSSREAICRDQFQTKRLALNIFTSFFLACKYDMDLMLLNCNFLVSRFPSQNKILHSGKRVLYFTTKAGYTRYGQPIFFGLTFNCSDFFLFFKSCFYLWRWEIHIDSHPSLDILNRFLISSLFISNLRYVEYLMAFKPRQPTDPIKQKIV